MAIAVYGRLDELLRERNLTVAELKLQIEVLFGLKADDEALARLTGPDAAHQTDMTLAVAAIRVLGVSLDDLFAVDAGSVDDDVSRMQTHIIDPTPRRIRELLDVQLKRKLSDSERRELEALVEARTTSAHALFDKFGNDPRRIRAATERARRRTPSTSS